MSRLLTRVVAKFKKLSKAPTAARPRRARLGVEALESRLVMSGSSWGGLWSGSDYSAPPPNPWSYTLPSGHGSDTIVVSANGGYLQVLDNGAAVAGTPLPLSGITSIAIQGGTSTVNKFLIQSTPAGVPVTISFGTGSDSAVVGSAGSAQYIQGSLTIRGDYGTGNLTVDDSADAGARTVTMDNGSLIGLAPGQILYSGLPTVVAKAGSAAGNSIKMYTPQTAGNSFTGRTTYCTLKGSGYYLEADNFAQVDAVSLASGDSAMLWGPSSGTNTFTANRPTATLTGSGYSLQVDYFGSVHAVSSAWHDTATLYGQYGTANAFTAGPTYCSLVGSSYDDEAEGFNQVVAKSATASDVAYLHGGSAFQNGLWASPSRATLYGSAWPQTYTVEADAFPQVVAYGATANDTANLSGSYGGTNTLTAYPADLAGDPAYASLSGGGYSIQVSGFNSLTANSHSSYDIARLFTRDRTSTLVGLPNTSFLCGFGWAIQANFSQVNVYGNGASGAWLVNPGVPGYWNGYAFYGSGWYVQPVGFASVNYSSYSTAYAAAADLQSEFTSLKSFYHFVGSFQVILPDPGAWWSGYADTISW